MSLVASVRADCAQEALGLRHATSRGIVSKTDLDIGLSAESIATNGHRVQWEVCEDRAIAGPGRIVGATPVPGAGCLRPVDRVYSELTPDAPGPLRRIP